MAASPYSFRVRPAIRGMFATAVKRSRPFALILVILLSTMFVHGQSLPDDPDELAKELEKLIRDETPTELTAEIMHQVVAEILRQEVKPGDSQRVVLVSAVGVNEAWLPKIDNVHFMLISPRDPSFKSLKYYSFEQVRRKDDVYSILLLSGAHAEGRVGTYWEFKIEGSTVVSAQRTDRQLFIDYCGI